MKCYVLARHMIVSYKWDTDMWIVDFYVKDIVYDWLCVLFMGDGLKRRPRHVVL
jgi:hypothetical protein